MLSVRSAAACWVACCAPGEREDHGDVNASALVCADRVADKCLVAGHVDGVDHLVRYGGKGARPVAREVGGPDGLDGIAVAGPGEAAGVGIDDGVGEQIVAYPGCGSGPVADADVNVGVDRRVSPAPDLLHEPGDVAGWQVVEQNPVGLGAREAEHFLAEGAQDDLGLAIAQLDAEAELSHLVVVTGERDRVAGQALAQQGEELTHVRQRPSRITSAVPVAGHHRRGDADAEQDLPVGRQRLQGGGGHGQQRRRTDLHGQHAGAEPDTWRSTRRRAEHGERFDAGHLSHPERVVPEAVGTPGQINDGGRSGTDKRCGGEAERATPGRSCRDDGRLRGFHDRNYAAGIQRCSGGNQTRSSGPAEDGKISPSPLEPEPTDTELP